MFSKIVLVLAVVGYSSSQHHASSYSSINHVQHEAPSYHAAPVYHAAPAILKAPVAYHHAPAIIKTAHVAPVAYHSAPVHHEEYPDAHPQYNFKYGVEDAHTGDIKSQQEERDGDVVHGEYTLVQPDGVKRIVHYTADKNGFNADVQYDGHAAHPEQIHKAVVAKTIIPAKVVAPVYHAPAYHSYHH